MIIIPAIDLMGGKAVRLTQGDRNRATEYSAAPEQVLTGFASAGAKLVHVVDLDGAFAGAPAQTELIAQMVGTGHAAGAEVQVGGGVRDARSVATLIDAGVDRVVIGTIALRDPSLSRALCETYPGRIVIAVDARDGMVAIEGWQASSQTRAADLAKSAEDWGAAAVLHTDVARDGLQSGPAIDATAALQRQLEIPVYASGGVGALAHLDQCATAGIRGVVLGRALYEGSFTVEEALARC